MNDADLQIKKKNLLSLLKELIESGKDSPLSFCMEDWIGVTDCGTSCCLCGDAAVKRVEIYDSRPSEAAESIINEIADDISVELDEACEVLFGDPYLVESVYFSTPNNRYMSARSSKLLDLHELKHPHLNKDHKNRETAHDYIRLVMKKVDEYNG